MYTKFITQTKQYAIVLLFLNSLFSVSAYAIDISGVEVNKNIGDTFDFDFDKVKKNNHSFLPSKGWQCRNNIESSSSDLWEEIVYRYIFSEVRKKLKKQDFNAIYEKKINELNYYKLGNWLQYSEKVRKQFEHLIYKQYPKFRYEFLTCELNVEYFNSLTKENRFESEGLNLIRNRIYKKYGDRLKRFVFVLNLTNGQLVDYMVTQQPLRKEQVSSEKIIAAFKKKFTEYTDEPNKIKYQEISAKQFAPNAYKLLSLRTKNKTCHFILYDLNEFSHQIEQRCLSVIVDNNEKRFTSFSHDGVAIYDKVNQKRIFEKKIKNSIEMISLINVLVSKVSIHIAEKDKKAVLSRDLIL